MELIVLLILLLYYPFIKNPPIYYVNIYYEFFTKKLINSPNFTNYLFCGIIKIANIFADAQKTLRTYSQKGMTAMIKRFNNVQASGIILSEYIKNLKVLILVGVTTELIPVEVIVDRLIWENFKKDFPEAKSITVNGQLMSKNCGFAIRTSQIRLFHNDLGEVLDESGISFCGAVTLSKKINFQPKSNLYLKRLIFKAEGSYFEATALRGIAPYFDEIEEGDTLLLKANLVLDPKHAPYWRIQTPPELIQA